MADDLDVAQFWLPSHFLTDEDILTDFDLSPPTQKDSILFGSASASDLDLPSNGSFTGSEYDQDEFFSELTPQISSKGWNLSSSPQSTLCGYVGKGEGCSSRGSPNESVSPPSTTDKEGGGATTLDLLNKAAGEVARFKTTKEKTRTTSSSSSTRAGTGFFDCSSKGQFCPPPISTTTTPSHHVPFFSPLHFPPFSHQMNMRQKMINKSNKEEKQKNRPVGLPQTGWPPLQAQNQAIKKGPHMIMGPPGPKKECVGTGVFLPRRVDDTSRKKNEGGNPTKNRNRKGNNKDSNSHHQRSGSKQSASKSIEIRLPPEWTY